MSQDQAPAPPPSELVTPTTGAILASHRRELGLSVEDVSAKLKLSCRQIEALETDRYDALPGNTFVRGFVRNYARLLQIDAQPLIHYLDTHLPVEPPQSALPRLQNEVLPTLRPVGSMDRPAFFLAMAGSLVLVLLVVGGFWYMRNFGSDPVLTLPAGNSPAPLVASGPSATSSVQPELVINATAKETGKPTVLPEGQISVVPAPATSPAVPPPSAAILPNTPSTVASSSAVPVIGKPEAPLAAVPVPSAPILQPKGEIRIVAKAESWVQITDSTGRRLINELIPAGQVRAADGKPPYQVRIGNGRQTELYYKGKVTDLAPYIKVDVANLELN
ncbi:RodZ domain-containing protein [Chitinimonas sp. PSY-7]|uniref:RodZ domain-containing protein n=1 Tax=Chitinimonas sp. PSY-7 TaxID=3459088 RepID=UPI0040403861